jgi:hypothetical protein
VSTTHGKGASVAEPKPRPDKQDAKAALERVINVCHRSTSAEDKQALGMVAAFLMALIALNRWED